MKFSKKMILIPFKNKDESFYNINVEDDYLSDLNHILRRSDLSIDEKMKLYMSNLSKVRVKNDTNQYSPTVKILDTMHEILLDIQKNSNEKKTLVSPKKEAESFSDSKNTILKHNDSYYKLQNQFDFDNNEDSFWTNNGTITKNTIDSSVIDTPKISKLGTEKKQTQKFSNKPFAFSTNTDTNEVFLNSLNRYSKTNHSNNRNSNISAADFTNKRRISNISTATNKSAKVTNKEPVNKRITRNNNPVHDSPVQPTLKIQRKTFY